MAEDKNHKAERLISEEAGWNSFEFIECVRDLARRVIELEKKIAGEKPAGGNNG